MTGMAAAGLMLHGEVGVLRTLPKAPNGALERLRRAARALGVDWPADRSYAEVVHGLDPANPRHAALLEEATSLLRGAGYTAFDGGVPEHATHAAVAAEYAHATAPLRRLVDRYVSEVCLALCAGAEVPGWARSALPQLPDEMAAADRRAHELERECVALMEAAVLHGREGQEFDAVVVELDAKRGGGTVQLADPAVRATCDGRPAAGGAGAGAAGRGRRRPGGRCGSPWPEHRYAGGTADEPAGRSRRGLSGLAEESPGSTGQGGG